jgi:hypothetical protein
MPADRSNLQIAVMWGRFSEARVFASRPKPPEMLLMSERLRQDLDGDLTTQRRIRCLVHLPHSAFADRRSDFVDAEAIARGQGHLCREYKGRT